VATDEKETINLRNAHVLAIVILMTLVSLFYYLVWGSWEPVWHYFRFEFVNKSIGLLYIIPIAYATAVFSFRGCVLSLFASLCLILPQVVGYSFTWKALAQNLLLFSVPALAATTISLELQWRDKFRAVLLERDRQRSEYIRAVLNAQESERLRIAQELHDDTMQSLLALAYTVQTPYDSVPSNAADGTEQKYKQIRSEIIRIVDGIRVICQNLRPVELDTLGLVPSIEALARRVSEESGIRCQVTAHGEVRRLRPEIEAASYRIVQEALSNVRRHSRASRADVLIHFGTDSITLQTRDNGVGLPDRIIPTASRNRQTHMGILGIMERARAFGGSARVESPAGGGTIVCVVMPLRPECSVVSPSGSEPPTAT